MMLSSALSFALCRHCVKIHSGVSARALSTTDSLNKGYEKWPYENIRRVGRRPNYWRGQGGKKSRIPYDKRYPMTVKDVNETTEGLKRGGNADLAAMIAEERAQFNPAVLKYYDYAKDREIKEVVPEMIPEFIVPDLKEFKLKPYVSYGVDESVCTQPKHTPDELYQDNYQDDWVKEYKKNV